ncbi:MAG: lipid-binding SYLF domain-containing protein [Acidobacteriales bacterium]|nr:lipid-binding SYLF domain-containing protein [Terriglobales bacterium]
MTQNLVSLKKYVISLLAVMVAMTTLALAAPQDKDSDKMSKEKESQSDIDKRLDAAAKVLNEIMATPDKGIPDNIFASAKCVAVVPNLIKIAIGFGGSHGKGVATCRNANGWSAPAPITLTGGSWGLQLGGQATDLVLMVMNDDGMQKLLSSKFKIGAGAAASAGPVGRHAQAGTDWKLNTSLLSYSRSKGLFAGIDLNGSSITQDKDETRLLYGGKFIPFSQLLDGKVHAPASAGEFLSTVRKYSSVSAEQKQGE